MSPSGDIIIIIGERRISDISSLLGAIPGPIVGDHVAPSVSVCSCLDDGVLVGCTMTPFLQATCR